MSTDLKEVRILMLGEAGVGKTSLILSLISEQFYDDSLDSTFEIPAKLEPITIPAEVTLEKVPGVIIDFSSREQTEHDLMIEMEKANVICLVYATNDANSKEKLQTFYLPRVNKMEDATPNSSKRPIIIVANKNDISDERTSPISDPFIAQLIKSNSQIETCIECSAKTLKNVPEVFYYAQKTILYPTIPIYDAEKRQLTPLAVRSLTRVFCICDTDNNGVLSDEELNQFQIKCFGIRLNGSTLQEVKTILRSSDNLNEPKYLLSNEVTLDGFLYLNQLFINKGRHETFWTVLKKFGYDRTLSFQRDYVQPTLKVPPSCAIELSTKGFEFLQYLFNKHDADRDDCLNKQELDDLFSVCPIKVPWGKDVHNTVQTDENGNLTYIGYLSQWILTTYFDVKTSIELFAYLGYNNLVDESQLTAFTVSRPKQVDIARRQTYRNTFLCYVYGRKKCGKSAFLQGHLGRDLQYQATLKPDEITRWSCNLVQFQNIEKYLILKEINSNDLELHEVYPPDVVLLMYDLTDPSSFQFIADIFLTLYKDRPVPCMIVGTKSDQTEIPQKYPISVEQFAEIYKLLPPQYFSASTALLSKTDIYAKIVAIATYPKMFPMKSQIWQFFQKLGSAATPNVIKSKKSNSLTQCALTNKRSDATNKSTTTTTTMSTLSFLNPINLFSSASSTRPTHLAKDPDAMLLRYSILVAGCTAVTFIILRLLKN